MDYGNYWRRHWIEVLILAVLWLACTVLVVFLGCPVYIAPFMGFPLFGFWVFWILVLASFRVRVRRGHLERVFLNRVILQRQPLSRFSHIEPDVMHGDRVVFEGGQMLRLYEMPRDELQRMQAELPAHSLAAQTAERLGCDGPTDPVKIAPQWLAWQGGTVEKLAQTLEAEGATEFGILADALEDAGCSDEALLSHLRRPGGHVPGCWAIDAIRGERRQTHP